MNTEKYHLIRSFVIRDTVLVSLWLDSEINKYFCNYQVNGRKFVTNRYASSSFATDEAVADIYKKIKFYV